MCTDNLYKIAARGEDMMARRFEIFDRSIGQHDSQLDCVVSFLVQSLHKLFAHRIAVVRMDPLRCCFVARKSLRWIEPPDSVIFVGPIDNASREGLITVEIRVSMNGNDPIGAGMGQP